VRAGKERGGADVDLQAALHLADDGAFDGALRFERLLDVLPHAELLGLLAREDDAAVLGLGGLEVDVDLVAFFDRDGAVALAELVDADLSFALVADVDGDVIARHQDDASLDDLPRSNRTHALFEKVAEIVFASGSTCMRFVIVLGHQLLTPWVL
jgi:hypothetical protein